MRAGVHRPQTFEPGRWARPLILLAVMAAHVVIVLSLLRAARPVRTASRIDRPLEIFILPREAATATTTAAAATVLPAASTALPAEPARRATVRARAAPTTGPPRAAPAAGATAKMPAGDALPREPPRDVDWAHEAELAVQSSLAAAAKDDTYRNLAGLSAAQQNWVRQNHLEPAPPGIHWAHPRVEVMPGGMPIIWINDNCIAVPVMMLMVFCKIGHIEANGDLFKHMGDPQATGRPPGTP